MSKEFGFWKMHGAGNDFVLVDDREAVFPVRDAAWLRALCARRSGVGADGVILIRKSGTADFRMVFFNPDGTRAAMCGNGARCAARLACEEGIAPASMALETDAGVLHAEVRGAQVLLEMTPPEDWRLDARLTLDGTEIPYGYINTGVPHVVVERPDLGRTDVLGLGSRIRHHPDFAPAGTNANFVAVTGPDTLSVRTYERGVESETLACGTGIVASALVCVLTQRVSAPVQVRCAHGDVLTVDCEVAGGAPRNVTLRGPAEHVFRGTLSYRA